MNTDDVIIAEGRNDALKLTAALLLYQSASGSVYATSHDILETSTGGMVLGTGKAAGKNSLSHFADAVSEATAYRGMVPPNLLYTAPNTIAWWTPPAHRKVWFRSTDEGIGNAVVAVRHPGLIFFANESNWFVFATPHDDRPDEKTPLHKAPYFNVWADGRICTGNVDLPTTVGPESIKAYEDAFFRSHFTHPNDPALVKFKGGATELWRQQIKEPHKTLLVGALASRKETLKQMIQRLTKGK